MIWVTISGWDIRGIVLSCNLGALLDRYSNELRDAVSQDEIQCLGLARLIYKPPTGVKT
jgi:hypothetical protein